MGGACREQLPSLLSVVLFPGQLKLPDVSLKEELRAAIKAVYEGKDVFVCLPTARVCATKLCLFVLTYKQASAVILFSPTKG